MTVCLRSLRLAMFCSLLLLSFRAAAGNTQTTTSMHLDRSYVTLPYMQGVANIDENTHDFTYLGVQVSPHFVLLSSRLYKSDDFMKEGFDWTLTATPMIRLRMSTETSRPVRTPSYMPKGTLQLFYTKQSGKSADDGSINLSPLNVLEVMFVFSHHSNGQEGCIFEYGVHDDENCADRPADEKHLTINHRDGNFSTNFLRGGLYYQHLKLDPNSKLEKLDTLLHLVMGAYVEVHPRSLIDDRMEDIYGRMRIHTDFETEMSISRSEELRLAIYLNGEAILDKPEHLSFPGSLSADVALFFDKFLNGVGPFVSFFYGQDDYNLGFDSTVLVWKVGIMISNEVQSFGMI